jgi:hypothetical protein
MDEHIKRIFVFEIERQAKFAVIASSDLEQALRDGGNIDTIWYSVQAFLIAAGNLSKLFWPIDQYANRGRELRDSFALKDDSILAPRTFRNHFEHFDERLEAWATGSPHRTFVDSNVGPRDMIGGFDPGDYLRNFDTQNFAVTFRGDTYLLRPIIDVVRDLHGRAAAMARSV